MTLDNLIDQPFCSYLATPYTKHRFSLECAWNDARRIANYLEYHDIHVYSPIVESHAVAAWDRRLDPLDHDFWMARNLFFLRACPVLIVPKLDGWKESAGVQAEIAFFEKAGKPVIYLDPAEAGL